MKMQSKTTIGKFYKYHRNDGTRGIHYDYPLYKRGIHNINIVANGDLLFILGVDAGVIALHLKTNNILYLADYLLEKYE